jgi:hypothetical protein
MPRYLRPRSSNSAIGICDRCNIKFYLSELKRDKDRPGLRVCDKCNDAKDPYKLPIRNPDKIDLPFYRPDEPLSVPED